jgi:cobalt/nickel transport protein
MNRTAFLRAAAAMTVTLTFSGAAHAHFQLLYTPEVMLEKPAEIDIALVFGHPMENSHTMDMGQPEEFFVVLKGEKTDLTDSLDAVDWHGPGDEPADAYTATYKVRRNGDYLFGLVPAPYMEGAEDIYIQQITKTIVNKGAMPTGWNEPLGLPTEIVPMNKPYQVFAGSTFTGQLLSEGEPAAGVECEIEYINSTIDLEANRFSKETKGPVPDSAIVAITDENGLFTFGIPHPGVWGFACLGSGPDKEHEGKELSQDAVLWINATAFE